MAYLPSMLGSVLTGLLARRRAAGPRWGRCGRGRPGPATASSGRDLGLPRAPPGALARDDLAAQEEFSAPDSPRLAARHGAGEARDPDDAPSAQGLGRFDIRWGLGEKQVWVHPARQLPGIAYHGHLGSWESLPYRLGGHRRRRDRFRLLPRHPQ